MVQHGLFPILRQIYQESNATALDTWKKAVVNERFASLIEADKQLSAESENLSDKRTDNEKYSPLSEVNKTLFHYVYATDDNKVNYLRNALLNGIYGDYTLELREDLFRITESTQPLDIHILQYLVKTCGNHEDYLSLFNDVEVQKKDLREKYEYKGNNEPRLEHDDYEKRRDEIDRPLSELKSKLSMPAILKNFKTQDETVVQRSLDRLQSNGLVYNNGANHFGPYNPYHSFIPLKLASIFLNFVSDPRNSLKQIST